MLVHGLPSDAATWREEKSGWSAQDEWAATITETIDVWSTEIVSCLVALGGGKPKLPRPERIEHPDRPELKPVKPANALSVAEFERSLASVAPTA